MYPGGGTLDNFFVTVIDATAMVVVSVWLCVLAVGALVSVAETLIVPCWPTVAPTGVVPQTTKLNELPAANGPVEVTAEPLSGAPFWSASRKYANAVCANMPPVVGAFSA